MFIPDKYFNIYSATAFQMMWGGQKISGGIFIFNCMLPSTQSISKFVWASMYVATAI